MALLNESTMLQKTNHLRRVARYNVEPVCAYKDLAYPLGLRLQALLRNMQFTPLMPLYYKKAMSEIQVAVE